MEPYKKRSNAGIVGIGVHIPKRKVSNKELERYIDTSDEWITEKTGIRSRHFTTHDKALSDIAIPAARKALNDARVKAQDVDVVIVGAMSHDFMAGALTGNIIKKAIGAHKAYAIDLNIICAGFIYCTEIAASMIESGKAKTVLVINGEVFSKYPHSRVTSVIFGDGAGAVVMKEVRKDHGLLASDIGSSIDGAQNLGIFVGGSRNPFNADTYANNEFMITMNGREIFNFAVESFKESVETALKKAGLKISDVDHVFSHQANINIIREGMRSLGLPMDKTYTTIHKYGNIGGGSIVTVLHESRKKGILKKGDVIVNVAFGSGLAWGANVMRWA